MSMIGRIRRRMWCSWISREMTCWLMCWTRGVTELCMTARVDEPWGQLSLNAICEVDSGSEALTISPGGMVMRVLGISEVQYIVQVNRLPRSLLESLNLLVAQRTPSCGFLVSGKPIFGTWKLN